MTQTSLDNTMPAQKTHSSLIQERRVLRFGLMTAFLSIIASALLLRIGFFTVSPFRLPVPILIITMGISILTPLTCLAVGFGFLRRRKFLRLFVLLLSIWLFLAAFSYLIEEVAIPASLLFFIVSMLFSSSILAVDDVFPFQVFSAVGSFITIAAGTLLETSRLDIPSINTYLIVVLALVSLVYLFYLLTQRILPSLQIRLLNFSLAVSLIPLIAISYLVMTNQRSSFENQMRESLKVAAAAKAEEVDAFFSSTKEMMRANASLPIFSRYLSISENWRPSDIENELYSTIESLSLANITQGDVLSFGLLNASGIVEYDSDPERVGADESQSDYFRSSYSSGISYVADLVFQPDQQPEIIFSSPVFGEENQVLGVLRARFSLQSIDRLLRSETTTYNDQVFPIIIDFLYIRIVDTLQPQYRFYPIMEYTTDQINQLKRNGSLPVSFSEDQQEPSDDLLSLINAYRSYQESFFTKDLDKKPDNISEFGAVLRLTSVPWFLIYPQTQSNLLAVYEQQNNQLIFYIGLIGASIAIIASLIARTISKPILALTRTAEKVSGGDLQIQAAISTKDEIGALARAFNSMTSQLRDLIFSLEDRVQQRTLEITKQNERLTFRSQQLKTIAEVAGSVTATQDLQSLLTNVTHLINQRFGFYHIGVFLLDQNNEYAVLKAANSEGGQRMLKRNHRLRVGQVGIVGYATGQGRPRIATDVGEDAIYFNNPDLPNTRSEMALPLKIGSQVIGALDVQSQVPNAFTEEDIELFSILADQIAIAIMNNNLYEETNRALEDMKRTHQRYLKNEWAAVAGQKQRDGVVRYSANSGLSKTNAISQDPDILEDKRVKINSRPSPADPKVNITELTVPINLRGETIAVIRLQQENEQDLFWNAAKINTIQQIADQIALTLESARLFEQTLRRAERDRKAFEITNRIRSTTNFEDMIQIAVEEIKRELNVQQAQITIQKKNQEELAAPSAAEKTKTGQLVLNSSLQESNEVK